MTKNIMPAAPRSHATSDLPAEILNTEEFFRHQFPNVLQKGREAANTMAWIMVSHTVRRTYFHADWRNQARRDAQTLHITRVEAEGIGIIRVYDITGAVREFPALEFNFVFRPDAVLCIGPNYTVLFEVI